jgi:hypothetical protein
MVCSLVGEIERGEILAKMTKTRVNREERKITYKEDDIWLDNPQFLPPLLLALSTRRYLERTIIHTFQFHLSISSSVSSRQQETYITIRIRPWSIPRSLIFITHFLPYWIQLAQLLLILVPMLFMSMSKTMDSGKCTV